MKYYFSTFGIVEERAVARISPSSHQLPWNSPRPFANRSTNVVATRHTSKSCENATSKKVVRRNRFVKFSRRRFASNPTTVSHHPLHSPSIPAPRYTFTCVHVVLGVVLGAREVERYSSNPPPSICNPFVRPPPTESFVTKHLALLRHRAVPLVTREFRSVRLRLRRAFRSSSSTTSSSSSSPSVGRCDYPPACV